MTRTFYILTTSSSRLMQTVSDWMPVVLQPADWPLWLGETEGDPATLLRSADEDVLKLWPTSTAVDAVRNNGPDLLAPLQTSEAPTHSDAPPGANPAWIRGLGLGWGDSPPTFLQAQLRCQALDQGLAEAALPFVAQDASARRSACAARVRWGCR